MIIRKRQMETLSKQMRLQFEDRMVAHLRSNFPNHDLISDEEKLRLMIQGGMVRAARYDITFEDDIRRYLEYMLTLVPDFDVNPSASWAGEILRSNRIDGTNKMRRIDNVFVFSRKGQV
jgi:hypothetical protein